MSAIANWNQIVINYRQASLLNGNHWRGEHALWYDQWVKQNNYAEGVYPLFQPFVHGSVLEIGAGTGLFTQYLVQDAEQLHVLEPSADMLNLLKANIGNHQKFNYFKTTIEQFNFQNRQYDFVFAAHAFFNVLHIDEVLNNILNHCKSLGVLIGNGKPLEPFQVFRDAKLVEEDRARPPHHLDLIPVLENCGFHYDVCHQKSTTKYLYSSEGELLKKIAKQCSIKADALPAYREIAKPLMHKNKDGVFIQGNREHVCLIISKERVGFPDPNPAK